VNISKLFTFLLFKVIFNLLHDKIKNEKNKIIEIKEIKEPMEDKMFNKKKNHYNQSNVEVFLLTQQNVEGKK